ncbi:MAG: CRISPR system precrRNA processing endoribonuclease RAMP protein Cas6 [Geobacter sp.]|nr:CRISPR system precrRNA processing endoribonuclease RAMP protein Cas6 [Geobacter sp.]
MDIPLINLVFTLESGGGRVKPQLLFAFRQSYQAAFRGAVGCLSADGSCSADSGCPCRYTFDQGLSTDPAAVRRFQKPSLPFAFRLPLLDQEMQPGDIAEFSLTLVGGATNHLALHIAAVRAALPPQLRLLAVAAVASDGSRKSITVRGGKADFSAVPVISFEEIMAGAVAVADPLKINLLAPLRLMQNGAPLYAPSFPALAGALFRRISSLAYYYGGVELDCDFKWLAEKSRAVHCDNSGLKWVNWGGALQGVSGSIAVSGELAELLPFLCLGELLNVGKGASYGMGSYRLDW